MLTAVASPGFISTPAGLLVPRRQAWAAAGLNDPRSHVHRRPTRHAMMSVPLFVPSGNAARNARPVAGSGAGGTNPYAHYTALDKNTIPWHVASGFWGAQSSIAEANAPTGSLTNVNAANFAELESAVLAGSRRITLTASIDGNGNEINNGVALHDIEIIVPSGLVLKNVRFGAIFNDLVQSARIRIRGSTLGVYGTGGQIHHLDFCNWDDIIIDGLDVTGPGSFASGGSHWSIISRAFGGLHAERLAVQNCKGRCGGYWYIGDSSDAVFANCSVITGEDLPVGGVDTEAWATRFAFGTNGNIVVYNCDFRVNEARGTSDGHYRIRCHPSNLLRYVYVSNCRLVNNADGQMLWSHSAAGNSNVDGGNSASTWLVNTEMFADSSVTPAIVIGDTLAARVQGNTIRAANVNSDSFISFSPSNTTPVADPLASGNSYFGYSAPGSWLGPGDPTALNYTP